MEKKIKLEKERGWLMKGPIRKMPDKILLICQFYLPEYRLRFEHEVDKDFMEEMMGDMYMGDTWGVGVFMENHVSLPERNSRWVYCKKEYIEEGLCSEDEYDIQNTLLPFPEDVLRAEKAIGKMRCIYNTTDNSNPHIGTRERKWEQDVFGDGMKLVKLELEAALVPIRNETLLYVSGVDLKATGGQAQMQAMAEELKTRFTALVGKHVVRRVYFAQFVVQ